MVTALEALAGYSGCGRWVGPRAALALVEAPTSAQLQLTGGWVGAPGVFLSKHPPLRMYVLEAGKDPWGS